MRSTSMQKLSHGQTGKLDTTGVLLDAALTWELPWVEGLKITVSGHNLTGHEFSYVEPYDGWEAPLPARPREAVGRISYMF